MTAELENKEWLSQDISLDFTSQSDAYLSFLLVAKQMGLPIGVEATMNADGTPLVTRVTLKRTLNEGLNDKWWETIFNNRTAYAVWAASAGAPWDLNRLIKYDEPDKEDDSEAYDRSKKVGRAVLEQCFVSAWQYISSSEALLNSYLRDNSSLELEYKRLVTSGVRPLEPEQTAIMMHQAVREYGIQIPFSNGSSA